MHLSQSPKLSPMVYTALQIITRGRDNGVSVVDLGKGSGYDQKTCFYLVRQLSEMDLVYVVILYGLQDVVKLPQCESSPRWRGHTFRDSQIFL
jgi:hypothetical protein